MNLLKLFFIIGFIFICSDGLIGQVKETIKSDPNIPIFEIKNDLGQTVFAVYPGGVHIFIDDQLKVTGGGFKVGRLGTEKATQGDIFTVDPGEVNVFIDNPLKATGGGFKVGRIATEKATGDPSNYLTVTPDSTRVYVSELSNNGFAVGKYGEGETNVVNFLNLTKENYFIGHNIAPNISTGLKNNVFGFNAGHSLSSGYNNIFIGDSAGYKSGSGHDNIFIGNSAGWKTTGNENIFIGNEAGYNSLSPVRNVFIGFQAGRSNQSGQYNVYLGDRAATKGTGHWNTVVGGLAAVTNDFGSSNVIIGYVAGRDITTANNIMIGRGAGFDNTGNAGNNIFIGTNAGTYAGLNDADSCLVISNTTGNPLVYGEFNTRRVAINGTDPNGFTFFVNGTASGTSDWATPSDMRLKSNIITIPSALEKVLQLRGVSYDWKDKNSFDDKTHIGFIAQEVEKIIPEVVNNNSNGYSMQYAPITALLVEAIKEQQEKIDELGKRNKSLENRLIEFEGLKQEIEELRKLTKKLLNKEN